MNIESIYNKVIGQFNEAGTELGLKGTSVVAALFNAFICFFGYKYRKFMTAAFGFLFGFYLGVELLASQSMDSAYKLVAELAIGLICALISYSIYKLGIAIIVFTTTYSFAMTIIGSSLSSPINYLVAIIVAILIALTALAVMRPVVIVTTGIYGAFTAVSAFATIFGLTNSTIILVVSIILAVLGILYQFKTTIDD